MLSFFESFLIRGNPSVSVCSQVLAKAKGLVIYAQSDPVCVKQ